jgi:NDP-sugar pyrophosphorylase family protein
VRTFELKGKWLDIGSKGTLEQANRIFTEVENVIVDPGVGNE